MPRRLRVRWPGYRLTAAAGSFTTSGSAATLTKGGGGSAPENTKYVRAGASGSGSGDDWTNAYTTLPATLQRGWTYYVADGSYGSYTFDDAVSGTQLITIKKATVADHGTSAGWSDAYGDGQAAFDAWTITTSYWLIDGQVRDEGDWFDGTAYGFAVGTGGTQNVQINISENTAAMSDIAVQFAWVRGRSSTTTSAVRAYAIDTDPDTADTTNRSSFRFSSLFVDRTNNPFFIRGTNGCIVERNAVYGLWGNENNHGNGVNLYFTAENAVVRYNHFRTCYKGGADSDSGGTSIVSIQDTSGHSIYGNLFEDCGSGDGIIGFIGGNGSNINCYNNTAVKCYIAGGGFYEGSAGSGNSVRNNLIVNMFRSGTSNQVNTINAGSGATVSHNAYSASTGGGSSAQTNVPTSIFVDYTGGNYRLASATNAGVTLSSPFDKDIDGNTRGADGTWDRGAFEYTGA